MDAVTRCHNQCQRILGPGPGITQTCRLSAKQRIAACRVVFEDEKCLEKRAASRRSRPLMHLARCAMLIRCNPGMSALDFGQIASKRCTVINGKSYRQRCDEQSDGLLDT